MPAVMALMAKDIAKASELMPRTIQAALDEPVICEVIKISGEQSVIQFIEFELIKLSSRVTVGGNLTTSVIQFMAGQLVGIFPNESLADFKLCFERGAAGQYGAIFRMDGIILREWMEKYLSEKYEVLEAKLMKEKDEQYKPVKTDAGYNPDKHKEWLSKLAEACTPETKVPGMDEKDIRKYGQEKPVKSSIISGYKYFEVRGVQIFASTQEHAEQLAEIMLKNGELEEDI